ncbi:MAG: restriction endonuclease subunit S [Myxacorys chilensis ATA2-1-KO14]|jgi:type I restriction enzyme S subunit|nr:restriction endonuclease subunit S [Myxacorys chilensis ATA2-1-KO14]
MAKVDIPEEMHRRFVYYLLRSETFQAPLRLVSRSAQSGFNKQDLAEIELPIAPLEEQKRIAENLDKLFARVDACRDRLDRVRLILDRFRQSILATALSGELTEDWREENSNNVEPASNLLIRLQERFREGFIHRISDSQADRISEHTLPEGWLSTSVEAVGEVFLGRQRSPKNHSGSNMRPYIRAANITWDGWDFSDIKEMNFNPRDFERYKLQTGDVLINEGSGSASEVGKPAIWRGEIENCCFQNTLICVRPFEKMSEYLYLVFLYAALSKAFVEETRGIGIHHLGKERFSAFPIPLPPIREQQEIVRRVADLFTYVDRLKTRYRNTYDRLDRLIPTLLDEAFRGELVPQDPNDEPASILLERIRRMRAITEENLTKPLRRKPTDKTSQPQVIMLKRKDIQPSHLADILKEHGSMTAENLWSASQLEIDDFYDQLKDEEARGLLKETREETSNAPRLLEAA